VLVAPLGFVCGLTQPAFCSGAALSATTPGQVSRQAANSPAPAVAGSGGILRITQRLRVSVLSGNSRMRALTLRLSAQSKPLHVSPDEGGRARIERCAAVASASKAVTATAGRGK